MRFRWITAVAALGVTGLTYFLTFHYVYFANANTIVHGWPVPIVVFQRDSVDGPWLDYVGPTVFWGFPINLVLLLAPWFLLSWALNAALLRRKMRSAQSQIEAAKAEGGLENE